MKTNKLRFAYILFDILASIIAWTCFFFFRKIVIEQRIYGENLKIGVDSRLYLGIIIIPVFWLVLNFMSGFYKNPLRKSRLSDFGQTLSVTLLGTVIIFFTLILDDAIIKHTSYYLSVSVLFALQFTLSYIPRFFLTSYTVHRIHKGLIGFNTLIIGANGRATSFYTRIKSQSKSSGNRFIGFLSSSDEKGNSLEKFLPRQGDITDLKEVLFRENIEEVIIAIEKDEQATLGPIIAELRNSRIITKAVPDMYDILLGRVRMSTIIGTPLISINADSIPAWQYNVKRTIDYFIALISLIIILPLSIVIALLIKFSSKGPVIFSQVRIGRGGKKFRIYKFRTMVYNAEADGPELSRDNDPRITSVGGFMRKHRLDEIPNFLNVLKGDMSIVGPRPEREFYINKIVEVAPQYKNLLRVKPGITSWGQVKYGYASDIEEMIERLEYDLIYLDNMSLFVDLKIIIYTGITILRGRGI